jgi:hypothetical protein
MATYQISIDEKNISGKRFLALMKTLPFISISKNKPKRMTGLDEALKDIEEGRVFEIEDWKTFSEQMEKEALSEI